MGHKITTACVGCTICAKNCPVDAIAGELKSQHVINEKRCIECGVCGRVCPKGAVTDKNGAVIQKVDKGKWLKPHTALCSACSICIDVCNFGCLQISRPKHKGDIHAYAELIAPKKCVACEMCKDFCPQLAITMNGGDLL